MPTPFDAVLHIFVDFTLVSLNNVFVFGYFGCFAREHELSEFCISGVCHCLPIFWTHSSPFGFLSGNPFGMNGHLSTDFLLVLLHTNPKGIWGPSMPTTLPNPAELLRCHQTWSTLRQQSAVSMHSPMPLCLKSWVRAWSSSLTCFAQDGKPKSYGFCLKTDNISMTCSCSIFVRDGSTW